MDEKETKNNLRSLEVVGIMEQFCLIGNGFCSLNYHCTYSVPGLFIKP